MDCLYLMNRRWLTYLALGLLNAELTFLTRLRERTRSDTFVSRNPELCMVARARYSTKVGLVKVHQHRIGQRYILV